MERIFRNNHTQHAIGELCREFRMEVLEVPLREIMGNENVKTLSAFEHGRSSNMLILLEYYRLAEIHGELDTFNNMLIIAIDMTTDNGCEKTGRLV